MAKSLSGDLDGPSADRHRRGLEGAWVSGPSLLAPLRSMRCTWQSLLFLFRSSRQFKPSLLARLSLRRCLLPQTLTEYFVPGKRSALQMARMSDLQRTLCLLIAAQGVYSVQRKLPM